MKGLHILQSHFTPIQPSLRGAVQDVRYQEALPHPEVASWIYCYWELKTTEPLKESFSYQVVADGCIDVLWQAQTPENAYIMGFSNAHTLFSLGSTFHYMGIRFFPMAFPLLFQVDASELTNRFEALHLVSPTFTQPITELGSLFPSFPACIQALDSWFRRYLSGHSPQIDSRVFRALEVILNQYGNLHLAKDLDIGLSPRQLRRYFQFYIGDSPKSFCKIVRFQTLLKAKPSRESLRKNKLFFDLGYYDQAHFVKEFKHLYGKTPTEALD